jgi:hypothetical protein
MRNIDIHPSPRPKDSVRFCEEPVMLRRDKMLVNTETTVQVDRFVCQREVQQVTSQSSRTTSASGIQAAADTGGFTNRKVDAERESPCTGERKYELALSASRFESNHARLDQGGKVAVSVERQ